jgi:ubiquinone/menaquinone biosynthesis C-methylase UbiE
VTSEYIMGRTAEEYERLRAQARMWQPATEALLDRVGLAPGASCLDVGCGPGETMRLMAERVGPRGRVVGLDTDAELGGAALATLRAAGHDQCTYVEGDVESTDAVPDRRFDLVFGRLILLHVADPVAVLRRMWRWTAPGGHLVVQDYDMFSADGERPLPVLDEWRRVFFGTYEAVGRPVRLGIRLPGLLAEAGIQPPYDTEVAGRLEPLATAGAMLAATYRSVAPIAIGLGLVTQAQSDALLTDVATAMRDHGDMSFLWPLLIGVHVQRPAC